MQLRSSIQTQYDTKWQYCFFTRSFGYRKYYSYVPLIYIIVFVFILRNCLLSWTIWILKSLADHKTQADSYFLYNLSTLLAKINFRIPTHSTRNISSFFFYFFLLFTTNQSCTCNDPLTGLFPIRLHIFSHSQISIIIFVFSYAIK